MTTSCVALHVRQAFVKLRLVDWIGFGWAGQRWFVCGMAWRAVVLRGFRPIGGIEREWCAGVEAWFMCCCVHATALRTVLQLLHAPTALQCLWSGADVVP